MGNARSPRWGLVDRPYPLFYSSCRAPTFIPPRTGGYARTCSFSSSNRCQPKDQRRTVQDEPEGTSRREGYRLTIATSRKMTYNWAWLLLLFSLVSIVMCLPTRMEDPKKAEQAMKPKSKRTQETLMFGNQQNRQANAAAAAAAAESFTTNTEKRTLASSGLGGLKAALAEDDKPSQPKSPSNSMYEHETYSPYDKNYDYGKVLMNEVEEDGPRVWDIPPYSRYYTGEDRRKRSEKSTASAQPSSSITTLQPPTSTYEWAKPGQIVRRLVSTQQPVQAQVKRSIPFYQEPRFKRDLPLDIDPEDVLTLLSLWENERRNGNWRNYAKEEYENMMDDNSFLDEEDARNALPWLEAVYPSSRHYETLSPSDIGIVRTHPPNYYDQLEQQYEGTAQYGNPQYGNSQYGFVYPQRAYYPHEKRFMVSKKRTQSYDPYSTAQLQLSSQPRSYQYPHRVVY
ncbi:prohormone-2-like isoform X2 [Nylanderia fulva]|uniref:prohormone-2-like isoform X2 n=1 Tax=Nylanderia fulva TaxID=613905 RepID=UPI0010FAD697|nr:prohormone-2-like isoform X2 [Nylanderia fulva]